MPTEELVDFIGTLDFRKDTGVIEFGCGEGRDSIFLAKSVFKVTAIDIAPSAIQRAKEWASREGVEVDFQVNDVTHLNDIPDESFDLGVNIGCLQMFSRYDDRRKHFSEAFRVLKPNGVYFLCNMAVLTKEEVNEQFGRKWKWPKVRELTPRKILLPIIAGHGSTKDELTRELNETGFCILQRKKTRPHGICCPSKEYKIEEIERETVEKGRIQPRKRFMVVC